MFPWSKEVSVCCRFWSSYNLWCHFWYARVSLCVLLGVWVSWHLYRILCVLACRKLIELRFWLSQSFIYKHFYSEISFTYSQEVKRNKFISMATIFTFGILNSSLFSFKKAITTDHGIVSDSVTQNQPKSQCTFPHDVCPNGNRTIQTKLKWIVSLVFLLWERARAQHLPNTYKSNEIDEVTK